MSNSDSAQDLLDWNLGQPLSVRPDALLSPGKHDAFEEFFLALDLVFNDLKTVLLMQMALRDPPPAGDLSARTGQHNGLITHGHRLTAAIIHELLERIRESTAVLGDERFSGILSRIPTKCREMWNEIVSHAGGKTPTAALLLMIRNTSAFHYYKPRAIADGYRAFFFQDGKAPHNERAYVSVGIDIDATRFYYADAAAQRSMSLLGERRGLGDIYPVRDKLASNTNFALAPLLRQYIHSRDPQSSVSPLPERPSTPKRPLRRKRRAG